HAALPISIAASILRTIVASVLTLRSGVGTISNWEYYEYYAEYWDRHALISTSHADRQVTIQRFDLALRITEEFSTPFVLPHLPLRPGSGDNTTLQVADTFLQET